MKNNRQTTAIYFFILSLFISSCGQASLTATAHDVATAAGETDALSEEVVEATETPSPTQGPTATVWPPVFDPEKISDNRVLDSFILTRTDTITSGSGEVDETISTIEYIKEPFSLSESIKKYYSPDAVRYFFGQYWVGGRLYNWDTSGEVYIYLEASPYATFYGIQDKFQQLADMRQFEHFIWSDWVLSAVFVGQEDFAGIPANHFSLDQTNLNEDLGPSEIEAAQGDLYVAQDGNYLLYFNLKVTGYDYTVPGSLGYSKGVFEWTQELSSINQLTEITVPADFLEREQDPGVPLPVGTTLLDMVHYADGRTYDIYHYSLPVSFAEFLEFYRDLAPTNGWTVSSIGVKEPTHYICDSEDCVVLNKGSEKMILYPYEGGIGADYYD